MLGGNKTYECPRCKIVIDRDVNGARNNFLAAYGKAVGVGWDGASVLGNLGRFQRRFWANVSVVQAGRQ